MVGDLAKERRAEDHADEGDTDAECHDRAAHGWVGGVLHDAGGSDGEDERGRADQSESTLRPPVAGRESPEGPAEAAGEALQLF